MSKNSSDGNVLWNAKLRFLDLCMKSVVLLCVSELASELVN